MIELPGVRGDGMSGRNVQRKLGTTRHIQKKLSFQDVGGVGVGT